MFRSVLPVLLLALALGCSRPHPTGTLNAQVEHRFTHAAEVNCAAFSPDSQFVATASVDKTAKIWRVRDGALVQTLTHPEGLTWLAYSPDGEYLATTSYDRLIRVWRV